MEYILVDTIKICRIVYDPIRGKSLKFLSLKIFVPKINDDLLQSADH